MPDIFISPTSVPIDSHSSLPKEPETLPVAQKTSDSDRKENNHVHPLATFCQHPYHVDFADRDANEEILLFLRRHTVTNIPWILFSFLLLIIPPLLFNITHFFTITLFPLLPGQLLIITLFYYLLVFTYAFTNFITWYFNVSFITTKRIIDIDYKDIVTHNVAATKLTLLEDIDYTQIGFLRSLFDFGDVIAQTAAKNENFDFLAVPHPRKVVFIIEDLIGRKPKE